MRYLLFISLIFIFISCKDTDLIPETTQEQTPSVTNSGKVYLSISCGNSDGIIATRASDSSDPFDGQNYRELDYEDLEKFVLNGKIYIFQEAEDKQEASAICVSSGNLLNPIEPENAIYEDPVVKSLYYKNIELEDFDFNQDNTYYALVILNPFDITPPSIKQTFGDWASSPQKDVTMNKSISLLYDIYKEAGHHKKLITMVNATGQANHSSEDPYPYTPTTLVQINPDDIQYGEFDDSYECKTKIFVQRNVAKVTIAESTEIKKIVQINENLAFQINLANLLLDVINTETYPVQKIEGLAKNIWSMNEENNRFHSKNETYDQIYWAIDPNYDQEKTKGNFSSSGKDGVPPYLPPNNGVGSPLYCLENTMDYNYMLQGQTTRAIIRCKMNWWGSDDNKPRNLQLKFDNEYKDYLWNNDNKREDTNKQNAIHSESNPNGNDFDENGFFTTGTGKNLKLWDLSHIRRALQAKAKELGIEATFDINSKYKNDRNKAELGGYYKINELLSVSSEITKDQWKQLAPAIGINDIETEEIAYYFNCWVNYVVRIRHFSDNQGAAWDETQTKTKDDGSTKIALYNDSHLGRYGVLRNNWYEIQVKSIKNLGSPKQFPDLTDDDTDDMPDEHYIDVSINIKSWGKRQQSFTF